VGKLLLEESVSAARRCHFCCSRHPFHVCGLSEEMVLPIEIQSADDQRLRDVGRSPIGFSHLERDVPAGLHSCRSAGPPRGGRRLDAHPERLRNGLGSGRLTWVPRGLSGLLASEASWSPRVPSTERYVARSSASGRSWCLSMTRRAVERDRPCATSRPPHRASSCASMASTCASSKARARTGRSRRRTAAARITYPSRGSPDPAR
jgi:hypothetical protein